MVYNAADSRYENFTYNRCGNSGLKLPPVSLGLWHNFGGVDTLENAREMCRCAFDLGITHFDLANNYGPPPGSAEETFGKILSADLKPYRDEMIISTKAGYKMQQGPYGEWGSRKYLLSSLDSSLKRMGLEYVDIFYSHRFDPDTPLEETMGALDTAVRSGKAIYAGISNYKPEETKKAVQILRSLGTPCIIHQARYSLFDRWVEDGLTDVLLDEKIGCICFSPLAQGLLTDRYLDGIPQGSRASKPHGYLKKEMVTPERISQIKALNEIAGKRSQSLAQMSLAWVLQNPAVTSVLIGASSVEQIKDNVCAASNTDFSQKELQQIEKILAG
jgi:L-glyceraldehyde 3-phosphate reductase